MAQAPGTQPPNTRAPGTQASGTQAPGTQAHASQPSSTPLPPAARVLLVRLSALGDVLFSLEALASLKQERPDVRVDFLVEDRFASLLRGHPQIERLLEAPRRRWRRIPAVLRA